MALKSKGDVLNQLALNHTFDPGAPIQNSQYGATTASPTGLGTADTGTLFFDTTLTKPVWWTWTGWVDATGTAA